MLVFAVLTSRSPIVIRLEFFYKLIYGKVSLDLWSCGRSSENDQSTGHFQRFFFNIFIFFIYISPETVRLVIGKQTVRIKSLNLLLISSKSGQDNHF